MGGKIIMKKIDKETHEYRMRQMEEICGILAIFLFLTCIVFVCLACGHVEEVFKKIMEHNIFIS